MNLLNTFITISFGFLGALEKQKLVYVMSRDNKVQLKVSSPLEASKSNIITFAIAGLDTSFENPLFASIEVDYSEADIFEGDPCSKMLVFYELDLGLNHVIRKYNTEINMSSNQLLPGNVPH